MVINKTLQLPLIDIVRSVSITTGDTIPINEHIRIQEVFNDSVLWQFYTKLYYLNNKHVLKIPRFEVLLNNVIKLFYNHTVCTMPVIGYSFEKKYQGVTYYKIFLVCFLCKTNIFVFIVKILKKILQLFYLWRSVCIWEVFTIELILIFCFV